MRALSTLIFNGGVTEYGDWITGDAVILESSMTEANFSNKKLGVPGAMIISAWLSSGKDKGAMTSLNLSWNRMGTLVAQTASHQVLLKQLRSQGMALKDAMAHGTGSTAEGFSSWNNCLS
jgi:hypothetical protein